MEFSHGKRLPWFYDLTRWPCPPSDLRSSSQQSVRQNCYQARPIKQQHFITCSKTNNPVLYSVEHLRLSHQDSYWLLWTPPHLEVEATVEIIKCVLIGSHEWIHKFTCMTCTKRTPLTHQPCFSPFRTDRSIPSSSVYKPRSLCITKSYILSYKLLNLFKSEDINGGSFVI